ncbi:MAG: MCE family protein [Lapillicoccus sp.]
MTPVNRGDLTTGLLYLLLLVALLAGTLLAYTRAFSPSVSVTLLASDAGSSLQRGADVKVRGVLVGRVTGVSTTGDGARIDLSLDPSQARQIPAGATARLLPKTLFGERFVSVVVPSSGGGAAIESGATIHQDTSHEGVELQRVFDDLLPVLQTLQPEKLSATLSEVSTALRGRGTEIGQSLDEFSAYLDKFGPEVPRLADDLSALASVANTYSDSLPDLLGALDDLTTFAQTQVDQRQQLETLFSTVISSANTTGGWVGQNSSTIIGLSRDSLPALDVTARYASEFPCTFQALTGLIPKMDHALGAGTDQPGVHGTMTIVPSRGKYVLGRDVVVPTASGNPACPYVPTGTQVTAPDGSPTTYRPTPLLGATSAGGAAAVTRTDAGLGMANSPAENSYIAELMAPSSDLAPSQFPDFGSLLLGPALRGSVVTIR